MRGRRRRRGGCGCGCGGAGGCDPNRATVTVYYPDPDPVGAATALELASFYGLQLRPWGGVPPAYGPTGDQTRTYYGDLGPIQRFAPLTVGRGVRARAGNFKTGLTAATALPNARVPSASLEGQPAWSARAQFGLPEGVGLTYGSASEGTSRRRARR
jgi:hypothetical protein